MGFPNRYSSRIQFLNVLFTMGKGAGVKRRGL